MSRSPDEIDTQDAILIVGPGLGIGRTAHDLVAQAIASKAPLVLDADALHLLAHEAGLQHKLAASQAPTLLTPHPLEAARLLGLSSVQGQADRMYRAKGLAQQLHAVVILTGPVNVFADP